MHKHRRIRTFLLSSAAVVLFSTAAFAQVDAPPAAPEAPIDQPPPPPPPPPPPVEVAPPPPTPPAAVPMQASVAASTAIAPSQSPFKIETANGSSVKIGLLLQPQFQSLGNNTLDGQTNNLYIRRTRLLVGGTLFGTIEYFFDTDYPNLFLSQTEVTAGVATQTPKSTPGMNIQDAFATAKPFGDVFKIDAGYMLPPLSHNALQGAGTLYGLDYYTNSFRSTANTLLGSSASPVGRDTGVEARGLVLDGHLEYRIGLFQGLRNAPSGNDVGGRNFFRVAARLQLNLLDPETGFFYAGTYLRAKKVLSIGVFGDEQDSFNYRFFGGDVFADLPAGDGLFTAQVDVVHWQGGNFVAIPKQTALMAEAGYIFPGVRVSPILRFEKDWNSSTNPAVYAVGVAWWPYGHTSNLKLFYAQNRVSNEAHAANQVNLQWQIYFF